MYYFYTPLFLGGGKWWYGATCFFGAEELCIATICIDLQSHSSIIQKSNFQPGMWRQTFALPRQVIDVIDAEESCKRDTED